MDLDRFKAVNDMHGHGLGDRVLASAVSCVTEHLRPYDKVFRYGGDEFLVLARVPDLAAAAAVAQQLISAIRASSAGQSALPQITASVGYALAPDKRLATLPVVGYVLGSAVSTLPASHFMRRHGRRAGRSRRPAPQGRAWRRR